MLCNWRRMGGGQSTLNFALFSIFVVFSWKARSQGMSHDIVKVIPFLMKKFHFFLSQKYWSAISRKIWGKFCNFKWGKILHWNAARTYFLYTKKLSVLWIIKSKPALDQQNKWQDIGTAKNGHSLGTWWCRNIYKDGYPQIEEERNTRKLTFINLFSNIFCYGQQAAGKNYGNYIVVEQ